MSELQIYIVQWKAGLDSSPMVLILTTPLARKIMLTDGGDGRWQTFPGFIKQEDEETFYLHVHNKW